MLGGLVLLIWLPTVRCPSALTVVAGILAEASLYTYLVHYQVYALFPGHSALGVIASIAVGVLLTYLVTVRAAAAAAGSGALSSTSVPALR